jgi:isomerase DpgB
MDLTRAMVAASSDVFTLPSGDLTRRAQALRDFIGSQAGGLAVIDLREAEPQYPLSCGGIANVNKWERALRLIERSPTATVALLGQQVSGCALEVGLACDFRIAHPATRVIWHNDGAIWPSTALFRLVQLVGAAQTRWLTILGEPVHAHAAHVSGLVDVITDDPHAQVEKLRKTVGALHDLRVVRQLIAEATHTSYDDALGAHLAACDRYLRRIDD